MADKTYRERVDGLRLPPHCMNLSQGVGFHDCKEPATAIAAEADAELAACRLRIAELMRTVDALMLEYRPNEMTPEQMERFARDDYDSAALNSKKESST